MNIRKSVVAFGAVAALTFGFVTSADASTTAPASTYGCYDPHTFQTWTHGSKPVKCASGHLPFVSGQGAPGAPGAKGATGAAGAKGSTGAQGAPGAPGVGIPGAPGTPGVNGKDGTDGKDGKDAPTVTVTTLTPLNSGATVLTHVGGKIGSSGFATPLTDEVTLPAGTYQYTLYADFSRLAGSGADNPAGNATYGTAFLWADNNGDDAYDWKSGEALGGTLQTGPVPVDPTGSIEQPANGTGVIVLTVATKVQVGGFAYNSNTGQYGTTGSDGAGDFSFLGATASFIPLNVG